MDPLAPEYPELTLFQFASNNPIWKIEIEGLEGNEFQIHKYVTSTTLRIAHPNADEIAVASYVENDWDAYQAQAAPWAADVMTGMAIIAGSAAYPTCAVVGGGMASACHFGETTNATDNAMEAKAVGNMEEYAMQMEKSGESAVWLAFDVVGIGVGKLVGKVLEYKAPLNKNKSISPKSSPRAKVEDIEVKQLFPDSYTEFNVIYNGKSIGFAKSEAGILTMDLMVPAEIQGMGVGEAAFSKLVEKFNPFEIRGVWLKSEICADYGGQSNF